MNRAYQEAGSRALIEPNAIFLGWNIGFYYLTLYVMGYGEAEVLRREDQDTLRSILSKIGETAKFFGVGTKFTQPKSTAEARDAFVNQGPHEVTVSGIHTIRRNRDELGR